MRMPSCMLAINTHSIVTTNSLVDQIDLEEGLNVITYRQPGRNSVIPFLLCAKRRLRDRSERRTDCHTTDEHVVQRGCVDSQFIQKNSKKYKSLYFYVFYAEQILPVPRRLAVALPLLDMSAPTAMAARTAWTLTTLAVGAMAQPAPPPPLPEQYMVQPCNHFDATAWNCTFRQK